MTIDIMTQEDYEAWGWVFENEGWWGDHEDDRDKDNMFRSPRMKESRRFHSMDNLDELECLFVAIECRREQGDLIIRTLTDYFKRNPDRTTFETLIIG